MLERPLPVAPHIDVAFNPVKSVPGNQKPHAGVGRGEGLASTDRHTAVSKEGLRDDPDDFSSPSPSPLSFSRPPGHCAGDRLRALPLGPQRSPAAAVASNIKLDADDLRHPLMLDQNGNRVAMPTRGHPVVLASGVTPSYVAYTLDGDGSLPKNFPTVSTGAARAGQTTGPLHFNAVMQQKLDAELAQYGQTSVRTPTATYLVKPLARCSRHWPEPPTRPARRSGWPTRPKPRRTNNRQPPRHRRRQHLRRRQQPHHPQLKLRPRY